MRKLAALFLGILLVAGPVLAHQGQQRQLDVDASGSAEDVETGDSHDLEVNITGDVSVVESGEGVDETAHTHGQTVTVEVTVDDTTHEVSASVAGEGSSLEQAGFVAGEAWRLHVQGESFRNADNGAVFSGNVTLIGSNGEFAAFGNGTLTVHDSGDQTTYDLDYNGQATFE